MKNEQIKNQKYSNWSEPKNEKKKTNKREKFYIICKPKIIIEILKFFNLWSASYSSNLQPDLHCSAPWDSAKDAAGIVEQ